MIKNRTIRLILASVTAAITLTCLIVTLLISRSVTLNAGITDLPFNELTSKAIDTKLNLAETLFQIGILMLGALWGLVIAKKDEIQLVFSQRPEVVMFLGSSVLLLLSACSYGFYLNQVSHYFVDASVSAVRGHLELSVPDIFDQNVNYLFFCQIISLGAGIINGVLTLVSTHRLK